MDTLESRFDWELARKRLQALSDSLTQSGEVTGDSSRQILEERARRYAAAPERTLLASEQVELLTLTIADERYAIESRFIREVLRSPPVTPVPGAPPLLSGVTNLRGEILAVMNLGHALGCDTQTAEPAWVIVLGLEAAEMGIVCDSVLEVTTLRTDAVLAPARASTDVRGTWIRGVTTDAVIVLEGHAVLEDPDLHIDQPEM